MQIVDDPYLRYHGEALIWWIFGASVAGNFVASAIIWLISLIRCRDIDREEDRLCQKKGGHGDAGTYY